MKNSGEGEKIRGQVRLLSDSSGFRRSRQLCDLLSHVVEHSLRDNGAALKEYSIGVEVFNRPRDYDPRIDPIVRVQARNLRERLKAYYAGDGAQDAVLIELPKGSYVPRISFRSPSAATAKPTARPPANHRSIAVLPFENLGQNPSQEYLSDGISEELISILSRMHGLRVVARTSSFLLKGQGKSAQEIGRMLNARYLVEGSLQVQAGHTRVSARLVDAESGYSIWSDSWDRRSEGAFVIQTEIASAIAERLHVQLSREEARLIQQPGTENAASYEAYLKGWHYWHQFTDEGVQRALENFRRAIDLDPLNAPAHAGLSLAYSILAGNSAMAPAEGSGPARRCAEQAVRLNPRLGEAQTALATYHSFFDFRWEESEAAFRKAIAVAPSLALGHHGLAIVLLTPLRRFEEAFESIARARQLDPLSLLVLGDLGCICHCASRYEEGVRQLTAAVELHPDIWFLREFRAYNLMRLGRHEEAWDDAVRTFALNPNAETAALKSLVAGVSGRRDDAVEIRAQLERESSERYVSSSGRALVEAGLGDLDRGLDFLEQAYTQREPLLRYLCSGFGFDSFWQHPRFDALRRKMRLPDPLSSGQNS